MNKRIGLSLFLAAALVPSGNVFGAATERSLFRDVAVKLGLGAGTFSRTVRLDDGGEEMKLKAFTLGLTSEFTFPYGITADVFAGLAMTDYEGLTFDHLPITLQYQAGTVRSFIIGGEIRKKLLVFGDFETGAAARIVSSLGATKTWALEDFAVEGESKGTPDWTEFSIGPTVTYTGYEKWAPYLGVSASWLRGRFKMAETLGDLEGTQSVRLRQKGLIRVTLGAAFQIARFSVRGEAAFLPSRGGVDVGVALRVLYAF
jgi:hypothetical protein